MFPNLQDIIDEDLEKTEILDVNEPRTIKAKGRPKGSKNEKDLMTPGEKEASRSTRRGST